MAKLLIALLSLSYALSAAAEIPKDELMVQINSHVVRVQVMLANGGYGVGSGVVIAKDQIVTNCHVIANAAGISVSSQGEAYAVSVIKPDWKHDVCLIKAEGIKAPIAEMGSSNALKYEQPVYAVGFPGFSPVTDTTYGYVKGLFPMDDSVIVRATSSFRMGDSGGGLFDEQGRLVGITTLKSPGRNAFYYNMSVEWAKALLDQPEQAINSKSELPFWAKTMEEWPHFMRVVQPYVTGDWTALKTIATDWVAKEPNSTEAYFYLATAEFGLKNSGQAEQLFKKVTAMNQQHTEAMYYLALIDEANGKHMEALHLVSALNSLDVTTADRLRVAIGMDVTPL